MKLRTITLVTLLVAFAASLSAAPVSQQPVLAFPGSDNMPDNQANSRIYRLKKQLKIEVETSGLDPLSPYTIWAVIFDKPEYCLSTPCGMGDLPVSAGHDPRVEASIVFAGGGLSDADGRGRFLGRVHTAAGRVASEIVLGTGALQSRRAEVHVVVRGHGYPPADELFAALSSFGGGCSDDNPCEDQQFAVHRGRFGSDTHD